MDIILLKNISTLGDKHDVVTVKPGYARNYLIPKKLALIANKLNMQKLDKIKADEAAIEAAKKDEYQAIADQLKGKTLKIGVKSGTSGKIFGSVTNIQVMNAIREQFDIDLPRKKIEIEDEVKELGSYEATLKLHPEVVTKIAFELVSE